MKSHSFLCSALALIVLGPLAAHASCTASTVVGTYGFAVVGSAVRHPGSPGPMFPVAVAGTFTFHADGTVNRAFTVSVAGEIASGVTDSGTYTVNADCSGTVALNVFFGLETFNLTIVGGGNAVHFINSTTGIALAGRMEKQ